MVNTECLVYFRSLIPEELRNYFHDALTVSAAPSTDVAYINSLSQGAIPTGLCCKCLEIQCLWFDCHWL